MADEYARWTKEALVRRVQELELQVQQQKEEQQQQQQQQQGGPDGKEGTGSTGAAANVFDPSRYATRFIALKIAYLGQRYGGFEFQPSGALTTIEEELWQALVKACLVPGRADVFGLDTCEYSKCGRTDRGVSAFGQVVALRVRSRRKQTVAKTVAEDPGDDPGDDPSNEPGNDPGNGPSDDLQPDDEIQYCKVLNRLLPPDIRVLAWCPTPPPGFSARFSCRERQYRYFFLAPPYRGALATGNSSTGAAPDGTLNIAAMRTAAHHFVGLHDFRNFCKLDPKKQITNYQRRIFAADIVAVDHGSTDQAMPSLYSFNVRGSAFLWHQIRHMVAVLFLVGQGREHPDVVPALLDPAAHPGRPPYAMAEDAPLVLWDCLFGRSDGIPSVPNIPNIPDTAASAIDTAPPDTLSWITAADEDPSSRLFFDGLWRGWHTARVSELLAGQLLHKTLGLMGHPPPPSLAPNKCHIYEGGALPRMTGRYAPLLQRPPMAPPEEVNDRYARQQGFASAAAMRDAGNWRATIRARKDEKAAAADRAPPP